MRTRERIAFAVGGAVVLITSVSVAQAQDAPTAEYQIRQADPDIGTNIKRNKTARGPQIALNLPYEKLPEADRQVLHSWWTHIAPGDEPPFPLEGLRALYEPLGNAHDRLAHPGDLYVVATVGADGTVTEAKVFKAPNDQMALFAGRLLYVTKFKPAVCSGKPCQMDFPLQMRFVSRN